MESAAILLSPSATPEPLGRVLVVDDEPILLKAYVRMLQRAGYAAEGVSEGRAAIERCSRQSFDLVVSDISMPGLGGMDLLRELRRTDQDLPIILMTGNPGFETAVKAVEFGALRYLVKPFELDAFLDVVAEALKLRQLALLRHEAVAHHGEQAKRVKERETLSGAFDRAMSSLWIAYQPIVQWPDRKVFAYEALMRTSEPALPNPMVVLDAAEQLGRLTELGRAIRLRVASSLEAAPAQVFVNLHPRDLLDDELYAAASPLSLHARRVVLEITERATLGEVKDLGERIASLRKLGFRIAIDDLGAGYSGLTSYALLEPEVVKFDMTLIRGLDLEPTKRKILASMTELFQEMGCQVVAEGVETAAERDAVAEAGCRFHQGYLFAKPGRAFPQPTW